MLSQTIVQTNCTNYQVVVKGMGKVFQKMPLIRRKEIANVLVQHLQLLLATFNNIACRLDIQNDAEWLDINLGPFAKEVDYSDLKELNITGLATLDSLSPDQKAELLLDPGTGALENVTILTEVFVTLTASPEEGQLDDFFQAFVNVTIQQNITYITNAPVRDAMLNLTLTALAPRFPTFQPSDFTLWFQVNLAVLLVSIRPPSLSVIPMNISCDSFKAIIAAFDKSLKTLPPGITADLQSSRNYLAQILPQDCTPPPPPVDVCSDTIVDEESLCVNASSIQVLASVNSTGTLCNFSLGDLACSSLQDLSVDGLVTLLECKLPDSASYTKELWKAFFVKVAGILDEALVQFSETAQNLTLSTPTVLEVIREVKLNNLTEAQLQDKAFISQWFDIRLGPFLPSVTPTFLTCVTNQSFSCQTFQAVVAALSNRSRDMNEEQKKAIFTHFLYPFLSRGDSPDPGCLNGITSSKDWLQKNFGDFSVYASLEDLQNLNVNFSSFESLELLTPSQAAQLTVTSGALNDSTKIEAVFNVLLVGNAFENVDSFLTTLSLEPEIPDIAPPVRDFVMNSTFQVISLNLQSFDVSAWIAWFQVKLIPILPSFTSTMLSQTIVQTNCTNYQVVVKGMGKVFQKMPLTRRKDIANVLVQHLQLLLATFNDIACRSDIQNDAEWLEVNLGPFAKEVDYSDLKELNITGEAVVASFTTGQKAEFILDPNNGAAQDENLIKTVFTSLLESNDESQLTDFFTSVNDITVEKNLTISTGVRDIVLNLTLTGLAPKFHLFSPENFALWFQTNLVLFLPSIEPAGLAVIPKNISCDSYSEIVKGFNGVFGELSTVQSENIFSFNKQYMIGQSKGLSCVQSVSNDKDWILKNFGQFSIFAPFTDFLLLKSDFNGVEAVDVLTETQITELASIPGQLKKPGDVQKVMSAITPTNFAAFFDIVSPAIEKHQNNYTLEVKGAFLQAIFDQGNLSSPLVPDSEILTWLNIRLLPLQSSLTVAQVPLYFNIIKDRSCNISQEGINALDSSHSALPVEVQKEIKQNILLLLKGSTPLRCYTGGSFYTFLKSVFLRFGFPDLSNFFSLIPSSQLSEILSSFQPSELNTYLSEPSVISSSSDLCIVLNNYNRTTDYLEQVKGPKSLQQEILSCVWSQALSVTTPEEAERWFDVALKYYLRFLTKDLISVSFIQNASCLPYRKLVSIMGGTFNYSSANFTKQDVYISIKAYLTQDGSPRCYNASDPELNSTSWFVDNIGSFITYTSVSDLESFCNSSQLGVFLENPANIQLFGNSSISSTVINYYTTQLYILNPTFSPVNLPDALLCLVPVSAFEDLTQSDSISMLDRLKQLCNTTEPEISAALVTNLAQVSANTIQLLGNDSTSLTVGQISTTSSTVLTSSLSTLSVVSGWNQGQANAIVQSIKQTMQINTAAVLVSLGTLIQGVPSATISSITSSQLLTTTSNTVFINNMLTAPTIVQQTYINKIISIDQSINQLMVNVPDALAVSIPRVLLTSSNTAVISQIVQKTWKPQQAVMFFDVVASAVNNTEELSASVLQGFSCSSVQTVTKVKVQRLIQACRPRRTRSKVVLKESQLTCMYNHVKSEGSQNFTQYPVDMLLYYNYDLVEKANCKSYFQALRSADFTVISSGLSIKTKLWNNAKSCLGITTSSLSSENVDILGNMVCTLDATIIQNSDPAILEKLKNCPDFTDAQISAIETILLSGSSTYGNSSSWNQQTLQDLGILPLYLTSTFWENFTTSEKRLFLRSFMPSLRSQKVQKRKLRRLFKQCNKKSRRRFRRAAGCVLGNITESTISDPSFPFGYDAAQFDLCLDVDVLKNNLATVTEKVDDEDFQTIILAKLNQAYPGGIQDSELQLLGSTARVATIDDISKWNITVIDTLSALMDSDDGEWNTTKSKAVIMKYLSVGNNTLGSNEINTIDANLCTLNASVLSGIASDSLKNAETVNLSSCSSEQKTILYNIAKLSFSSVRQQRSTRASFSYYNLISSYLGGASLADIRRLSSENISMDITTFLSLSLSVIKQLTVSEVQGLLGSVNINDLKTFENNSIIQSWITERFQSDLETLGLGLTGGKASVAAVTATTLVNVTNSASISTNTTMNTITTTTTTTTTAGQGSTTGGAITHQNSLTLFVLLISLLMLH